MGRAGTLIRDLWRHRHGASAVEFALVLPLLLIFLFGILQYGFLMFTYNAMLDTARDTARKLSTGAVNSGTAQAEARANLPAWIEPASWTIITLDSGGANAQVTATISIDPQEATFMRFVPMPETIVANVVMRKES